MRTYESDRWRESLFTYRSALTGPILRRATYATAWAVLVHWGMARGLVDSFGPLGHTIVGVAFGLLLVFRTNTSYDRFWEGRRLWGATVEECRNLARLGALHLAPAPRQEFLCAISVFAHSLMHSLRGNRNLGPHAEGLAQGVRQHLTDAVHVSTATLAHASRVVETALPKGVDATALRWTFEEAWRNLLLQAGGCHRIRTTPIPFPYTVHLRRALVGYAMTVPFAFANEFGWRAVPATFIVTYILFGIEELGVATENPFGNDPSDLPLESYCAAVDASLFDPVLASLATTDLGDSA